MASERVAVVTGGEGTFGRGIVKRLIEDGFAVASIDVQSSAGDPREGYRYFPADLQKLERIRETMDAIAAEMGDITALVNVAGVCPVTPLTEITVDEWRRILDINLGASFFCIQAVVAQNTGKLSAIVNISSVAGHMGAFSAGAHYSSSKAGLLGLTKTAARVVAAQGVRVNAICPGPGDTAMTRAWPEGYFDAVLKQIPLGESITPEDIAEGVSFLLSDRARHITGTVIDIDGGMAMR